MKQLKFNGKILKDATAPLTFVVSNKDVKHAKAASPMSCALAQGLTRHGTALSCRIGLHVALVEYKNVALRYAITHEDRKKIDAFDNAHYFQPGVYTLIPPEGWLAQPAMAKAYMKRKVKSATPRERSGQNIVRRQPMRHALRTGERQKVEG